MTEMYRADHVGSLLRPTALKEARAGLDAGSMTAEGLRKLELVADTARKVWG